MFINAPHHRTWILTLLFLLFCSPPLAAQPTPPTTTDSASTDPITYVLVHGAWGGSWDWERVTRMLRDAGHPTYRPSLTGLGERVHLADPDVDLETHIQDVVNALRFEDLTDVVLVGHSYGGMVITGVAERVPQRIARLIYIDAFLPKNGASLADLIRSLEHPGPLAALVERALRQYENEPDEEWRLPLPEEAAHPKDVPHPLATFVHSLPVQNPEAAALPGTYILTIDPGADQDPTFSPFAKRARTSGWPVFVLPTGHTPQRTMPHALVGILLSTAID